MNESPDDHNITTMIAKIFATCALIPIFLLDVVLYTLSFAWLRKIFATKNILYSVAKGEETTKHGAPRRSPKSPDVLITSNYDSLDGGKATTVYEMTAAAVQRYASKTAMVSQKFVELKKIKETDRFPTKIFDNAHLDTITYAGLGEKIINFGVGLRSLGMEPNPQLKPGQHFDDATGPFVLVIFEDTCAIWTIALQGAFSQSMTVATCYATLGEDAVVASVNETSASAILLNWKNAEKFAKLGKAKMPTLKAIIASTHEMPSGMPAPVSPKGCGIQIITTNKLIEQGASQAAKFPPVPPKPHDVAVIMYTSGSTGKPKGVVMKHSQLVAGVSGMEMNVDLIKGKDVYVSYLPLAHVLALQIENAMLNNGSKICYSDPRQLAKTLSMFKPTIHAGVPKVWELLRFGLEKKIAAGPAAVKVIFYTLLGWKKMMLSADMDVPVTNIFFRMISKKVFGGVLRFGVSGGGPMSSSLAIFCRSVFCCPVIQGYALTETCVGGCFQAMDDPRNGVVGPPVPCVEIMLQSEPDITDSAGLPYLHIDTTGANGEAVIGRGEICMRGPCISSGYYKMPDKTKEEYDEEGWFHTGDIGQYTHDGVIEIIDRKKNLVKLKGGEYVAVEAMETAFATSPFVTMICVVANGDLDRPLAIVRADNKHVKQWATENNISYDTMQDLASMEVTRNAVIKSLVLVGKEGGLSPLELGIRDCALITDTEWGPGNGLTATMKIDRKKIFSMHADELRNLLKRNGGLPEN